MNLKEYIENLHKFVKENGEEVLKLKVVYSTDDEGNNYHNLHFEPSLAVFETLDDYYLEKLDNDDNKLQNNAVIIN